MVVVVDDWVEDRVDEVEEEDRVDEVEEENRVDEVEVEDWVEDVELRVLVEVGRLVLDQTEVELIVEERCVEVGNELLGVGLVWLEPKLNRNYTASKLLIVL